ncbi:tRNA (cytosine-5-)-methyltransferase [Podila humilis]|nr:tRNA (cytosine-5-)-methyltransferase [Podila humilis]
MTEIRALEFFSGIGGLHHGFNASGIKGQVLESFDMNQQANDTYKQSFGKNPVSRGIDRLTVKDIEKYNANCWLMSPPCQPYTRGGKLLDLEDNRAKPLLSLLDQLERMSNPPIYLFLENVKNFETSRSRKRLVLLLNKMGYVFRECLLAPYNFGVPNDRLRYFLMARLRSSFRSDEVSVSRARTSESTAATAAATITTTTTTTTAAAILPPAMSSISQKVEVPFDPRKEPIYTTWPFPAFIEDPIMTNTPTTSTTGTTIINQYPFTIPEISQFLDKDNEDRKTTNFADYLLPRQLILERPNFRFDILRPSSRRSSCFTKAYGSHHVASGGGLLQTVDSEEGHHHQQEYDFSNSEAIAALGLRFLTPTEVARLHVFPLDETPRVMIQSNDEAEEEEEETKIDIKNDVQEHGQLLREITVKNTVTTVRKFRPDLVVQTQTGPFLKFPKKLTAIQRYKLLGNSLNVWVVAELLRGILFAGHLGNPQPMYNGEVVESTTECDADSGDGNGDGTVEGVKKIEKKHGISFDSASSSSSKALNNGPHEKEEQQESIEGSDERDPKRSKQDL